MPDLIAGVNLGPIHSGRLQGSSPIQVSPRQSGDGTSSNPAPSQDAGKNAVLESWIGKEFRPSEMNQMSRTNVRKEHSPFPTRLSPLSPWERCPDRHLVRDRFFLHQSLILPIALKLGSKTQARLLKRGATLPRSAHKGKGAPLWNSRPSHGPLRDGVVGPSMSAGWRGGRPSHHPGRHLVIPFQIISLSEKIRDVDIIDR